MLQTCLSTARALELWHAASLAALRFYTAFGCTSTERALTLSAKVSAFKPASLCFWVTGSVIPAALAAWHRHM